MSDQFNEKQFSFKAWVEKNGSNSALKLHVHGEVAVADETLLYQLDKKTEQGYFPEELFLVIKPDPTRGSNNVSIKYHEDVQSTSQYKKVTILTKTEQVFEITDIGVKE